MTRDELDSRAAHLSIFGKKIDAKSLKFEIIHLAIQYAASIQYEAEQKIDSICSEAQENE